MDFLFDRGYTYPSEFPPLHFLAKYETPDGVGVLIGIETNSNGLYVNVSSTKVVIWYGMNIDRSGPWVQKSYDPREIKYLYE